MGEAPSENPPVLVCGGRPFSPRRGLDMLPGGSGGVGRGACQQCGTGQRRGLAGRGVTFLVHCLTVLISSEITMSTHLRHGSRIFFTCFFTMVSKAMSGVKSPVLNARGGRRAVSQASSCQEGPTPPPLSSALGSPYPSLGLSVPICKMGRWDSKEEGLSAGALWDKTRSAYICLRVLLPLTILFIHKVLWLGVVGKLLNWFSLRAFPGIERFILGLGEISFFCAPANAVISL